MNQCDVLLKHLKANDHITQLEAIGLYRIFNLKGRINELRDRGYDIDTDMRTDATGKRYARYVLRSPKRSPGHADYRRQVSAERACG